MAQQARSSARQRPDVIMIIADQWRGQDQGWNGNREVITPRSDALARDGVAISGAIANHPVCGPGRGDLLTGLLPHQHRVVANDFPMPESVPTVGEAMSAAGYRTGWIGKWHLEGIPRDQGIRPGRCGFDSFASINCSHGYYDRHYYTGDGLDRVDFTGYEPPVQTELALQWLRDHDDRPSFLVLSLGPPHDPYDQVPPEYLDQYDPDQLTLRGNTDDTAANRLRQAQYYAGITVVDDQVGRIVDDLADRGRLDDTLLIITSDHGDMLGAHGRRAKQVPFAEAVRIPLVLHWPAGLEAGRPDGLFGLVDLAPTLLDLVGADPLPDTYGRSLTDGIRGLAPLREEALVANVVSVDEGWRQGVGEWRGFVADGISYARHVDGTPWLLFDDEADPWQLQNLVDQPDRVQDAELRLDSLLAEAADPAHGAEDTLRELDLVALWNQRETELNGQSARTLMEI
jgi:arylsulfatase A-like enzyme